MYAPLAATVPVRRRAAHCAGEYSAAGDTAGERCGDGAEVNLAQTGCNACAAGEASAGGADREERPGGGHRLQAL